jgi:hypothetical protein
MKINYNKLSLTLLLLLVSFSNLVQAQLPEPPDGGDVDPPAPINNYLIYLGIAAVMFAVFYLRKNRAQKA